MGGSSSSRRGREGGEGEGKQQQHEGERRIAGEMALGMAAGDADSSVAAPGGGSTSSGVGGADGNLCRG